MEDNCLPIFLENKGPEKIFSTFNDLAHLKYFPGSKAIYLLVATD